MKEESDGFNFLSDILIILLLVIMLLGEKLLKSVKKKDGINAA